MLFIISKDPGGCSSYVFLICNMVLFAKSSIYLINCTNIPKHMTFLHSLSQQLIWEGIQPGTAWCHPQQVHL